MGFNSGFKGLNYVFLEDNMSCNMRIRCRVVQFDILTFSFKISTFSQALCVSCSVILQQTHKSNVLTTFIYVYFSSVLFYNPAEKSKRFLFKFKVCKSVHHRTIQINHQPDATILQFIILTFIYNSTCFGRFPAHYQELIDCSGSLWFYLRIVVTVVLCSWSGRTATSTE